MYFRLIIAKQSEIVLSLLRCLLLVFLGISNVSHLVAQDRTTLIRNGRVMDGSGNPWFTADVLIRGGQIEAVGDLGDAVADEVIDATGLYVTPGFIDTHSHSGPGLATPGLSHGEPLLAMGLTTVFVNPDGGGPVDMSQQRASLLDDGLGVNVAQMVPVSYTHLTLPTIYSV